MVVNKFVLGSEWRLITSHNSVIIISTAFTWRDVSEIPAIEYINYLHIRMGDSSAFDKANESLSSVSLFLLIGYQIVKKTEGLNFLLLY